MPSLTVAFDFDGTLVALNGYYLDIYHKVTERYGLRKLTDEEFRHVRSLSLGHAFRYLGIAPLRRPLILAAVKREFGRGDLAQAEPVPGIRETLLTLRDRSHTLGIITTNHRRNVMSFLRYHDLDLFHHLSCDASLHAKHRSILRFMKRSRIPGRSMIYIGDEVRDIRACRRAGVRVIAVTWGFHSRDILMVEGPDHIIDRPEMIPRAIDEICLLE